MRCSTPLLPNLFLSLDAEANAIAAERAAEEEKRATLEAKLTAERAARSAEQRRLFIQKIAGIILLILLLFAIGASLLAWRNASRALAARADADDLNTYLLSDLREQLEEAGRLDLLDSAAQRAEKYLARLGAQPADDSWNTQRLLLAYNLGSLRLAQGRLGKARDTLLVADASSKRLASHEPALIIARARVMNALCDLLARSAENAKGQQSGSDALALLTPLASAESELLCADVLINLADLKKQVRQLDEATQCISQSLTLLDHLIKSGDTRIERRTLLRALLRAGDVAQAKGDADAAQAYYQHRLDLATKCNAEEPYAPLWEVERALSYDRLAQFWLTMGDLDKAKDNVDRALNLWKELLAHDPENLGWLRFQATTQTKLGQIFLAAKQPAEAQKIFRATVEVGEKLTKQDPGNLGWLAGLATAHSLLSDTLADLNAARDSLRESTTALEIRRRLHADPAGRIDADNTRNFALSLTKTAVALMNEGDYPTAERLSAEAVECARELSGHLGALPDDRTLLAGALETQGETLVGQERQPDGARLYIEARGLRMALANDFPGDPALRFGLAKCHLNLGGLYKDGTHTQPAAPDISAARVEYTAAYELLQKLTQDFPQNPDYKEILAEAKAALMEVGR